jgi:hypothetical protein
MAFGVGHGRCRPWTVYGEGRNAAKPEPRLSAIPKGSGISKHSGWTKLGWSLSSLVAVMLILDLCASRLNLKRWVLCCKMLNEPAFVTWLQSSTCPFSVTVTCLRRQNQLPLWHTIRSEQSDQKPYRKLIHKQWMAPHAPTLSAHPKEYDTLLTQVNLQYSSQEARSLTTKYNCNQLHFDQYKRTSNITTARQNH